MFRKFFAALSNLTGSVDALAGSFSEANERLRGNLGLDGPMGEPEQIEHCPADAAPVERRRKVAR